MIPYDIFTCDQKLAVNQLNIPYGTPKNRKIRRTKKQKPMQLRRYGPGEIHWSQTPERGRESKVGKICETCRFEAGYKRVMELWMMTVVNQRKMT